MSITAEKIKSTRLPRAIPLKLPKESELSMYGLALQRTAALRKQLSYKALRHSGTYIEVDEAYTSQTCSACGTLPEGRPKGIAGLEIRQWECGDCGAVHDRDVNAALNIARRGLATLAEGALA